MKLSIGILAHNEERVIAATIASLLTQTVIADRGLAKEIVVVANGCADNTASVAEAALSNLAGAANCTARVVELTAAGKANAWNTLIHEESAPDTDYFVLLDADIEFAATDAVARLIAHLRSHPETLIAPDQPVKKFERGDGPFGLLIRALQKTGSDDEHALSGQLYAARATALRAVTMPIGTVVEDGFLRAMTLTASFSGPETLARIRRAPGVRHYYRPYETFAAIYRYERRQAVGTTINRFLYDEFRRWRAADRDIATEIRRRNLATPDWLEGFVAERMAKSGALAVPSNYVFRRLRHLGRGSLKAVLKAPLVVAAVGYDLAIAIDASRQLRRRAGVRWDTIRTNKT